MSESLREYRRGLALYALAHAKSPMTAAETAAAMGELAMGEGHPPACWSNLDAPTVLGILRSLENAGLVIQSDERRRDTRNGRPAPTWDFVGTAAARKAVSMPEPPPKGAPRRALDQAPASGGDYHDLTRPQLYALLEVGDLALQELARMQQEGLQTLQRASEFNGRIRQKLVSAGLEDRLP